MKHLNKTLLISVIALSFSASAAVAEEREGENAEPLTERLLNCRSMESALERLDCYDSVTRALSGSAEHRSEGTSARQQQPSDEFGRESRRQSGEDERRRYIEITEAWQSPHGMWRFSLADGSEWHQTQSDRFNYDESNTYYIERGALSSFRLGWDGSNRNIRVRRVD